MSEAMAELGLKTGTIVTRNEDERMDAEADTIEVVPAKSEVEGQARSPNRLNTSACPPIKCRIDFSSLML